MLQTARFTAFTVSKLLRENQKRGKVTPPFPLRLGLSGNDSPISETLLFGVSSFNDIKNTSILNTTIDYILSTKRFDVPLTNS